jgi:hypothetical protein
MQPMIYKFISPIPAIPDVSPADYEKLKEAAKGDPNIDGAMVAIVPALSEVTQPYFFIATNLPSGTFFEVYFKGVEGTLIGAFHHQSFVRVETREKVGRTAIIRLQDSPLPRGQYLVAVVESLNQPEEINSQIKSFVPSSSKLPDNVPDGRKVTALETFYIGGPKNDEYKERLAQFHSQVREKASSEVTEVKQLMETMAAHSKSLLESGGSALRTGGRRFAFERFLKNWEPMHLQIYQTTQGWTPTSMDQNHYYTKLYVRAKDYAEYIHQVVQLFKEASQNPRLDLQSVPTLIEENRGQFDRIQKLFESDLQKYEESLKSGTGLPLRD